MSFVSRTLLWYNTGMDEDDFGEDTQITETLRVKCPECRDTIAVPIIIHTDGHFADIEIIADDDTDEEEDVE